MFLIAGIHSKVKPVGTIQHHPCPVCHSSQPLHVVNTYLTPHIFFIPTVKVKSAYAATCPVCASVLEVPVKYGDKLRRDPTAFIPPGSLNVVQNNYRPRCHNCNGIIEAGQRFCSGCGTAVE